MPFSRPNKIKSAQISAVAKPISPHAIIIAQFIKNCSGMTLIISSAAGSKTQLSLPGKNIAWKPSNALSKPTAATIKTTVTGRATATAAEIKYTRWPLTLKRLIILNLLSSTAVSSSAAEAINTPRLRLKSALQSAKCAAPSAENFKLPALNSVTHGSVQKFKTSL